MFIYLSLVVFFAAYRNEKALKCKPSPVSDGHAHIIIQVAKKKKTAEYFKQTG